VDTNFNLNEPDSLLDRAFLAGLPRIRIVHGAGVGILRRTLPTEVEPRQ
jgi:DNA mismatch repair protein MutS2